MKKVISLLFVMLLVCSLSAAEFDFSKISYGSSLIISMPTGDFGDMAGTGFGLSGNALYPINEKITATGCLGYSMWGGKDEYEDWDYSWNCIPFKGGALYQINDNFYAGLELGFYRFAFEFDYEYTNPMTDETTTYSDDDSETEIGFAPSVIYIMPLNNKLDLNFSLKYESAGDFSWLGIYGGVNF